MLWSFLRLVSRLLLLFGRSCPYGFLEVLFVFSTLLLAKFDCVYGIDFIYYFFLTMTSGAGIGACFALKGDWAFILACCGDLMESVSMMEEFVSPIGPFMLCGPIDLYLSGFWTNFFGYFWLKSILFSCLFFWFEFDSIRGWGSIEYEPLW